MTRSTLSRRALLASAAAALGCGRRKATGYPGVCLIANQESRSVAVVDLSDFRVRRHIPLDAAPSAILAHPDAAVPKAFVLAPEAGLVYEIECASLTVGRRARLAQRALQWQVAPKGDALWALCDEPASLIELPLGTLRPGRRIALQGPADAFELSSDGLAAIAYRQTRSIVFASLARGTVERTVTLASEPSLIRFRLDGKLLMTGSAPDRSLTLLETASGKVVVRLPLPIAPRQFCMKNDGGQMFITGDGMDAVVIAFPYTTEIDQTILAGRAPGAMTATDAYLLVTSPVDDSVSALNIETRRLVAQVRVGRGPGTIHITPDGQYALVLNEESGDMAVVRLRTFSDAWVRRYRTASLFTMIPVGRKPVSAAVVNIG